MDAQLAKLYATQEKAELVHGEVVRMTPAGSDHGRASLRIAAALLQHEGRTPGQAVSDNVGFVVELPNRRTFSPDAAWRRDPRRSHEFFFGAPEFAVEVRSPEESIDERAAKRADYFAAGTLVVWDVNPDPENPSIHRHTPDGTVVTWCLGEIADAEPAVPGFRFPVVDLTR